MTYLNIPISVAKIPYISVYESQDECRDRGYLMPGFPIKVNIINVERDASALHLFNPYMYVFNNYFIYQVIILYL